MKRSVLYAVLFALVLPCLGAKENVLSVFENSAATNDLKKCLEDGLTALEIKTEKKIPAKKLAAINYILKNTYENNIHKMRDEDGNVVYTKSTGEEAVFDQEGKLVTNDWNRGSFNYGTYDKPIQKFELDIWPWMVWGNTVEDPTTFDERLYYYCMDLDIGIQEYIFLDDKTQLEKIKYEDLSEDDKLVYHFFDYLLFNDTYKCKLDSSGIKKYRKTADNYWNYLEQIFILIGY